MAVLPRRIIKETERLVTEPLVKYLLICTKKLIGNSPPGITAYPYEDNLRYFNVVIKGPPQSPYEGIAISSL